jgi:sulfide:quinone oxidoreductase
MDPHSHLHDHTPLEVVVAGAGVGGLEAMVAIHGLAGGRAHLTLVAPEDDFRVRALEMFEPLDDAPPQRYPLSELAADLDATFVRDAIGRVERDEHFVHLQSGATLTYDVLVIAVGAFPEPAYEYGVCLDRADALDGVLAELESGAASSVAIVIPPGCTWTLPAYELALMLAQRAEPDRLSLVTHEVEPMAAFGPPGAELARAELEAAGVSLFAGVTATVPGPRTVRFSPSARLFCHRILHLPLHAGPNTPGLPCDVRGFIPVDEAFRVRGVDDVFAIGEATPAAFMQGGLATQQADVVAEHIAARAGSDRAPAPYRPVLRGMLRTARGPRYLRAEPPGGAGTAEVSYACLWWPPTKIAARWLMPWLSAREAHTRSELAEH